MKMFVTAVTAALLLAPLPASAAEGVWRVGDGFVVRSGALDLSGAEGRARYLDHVRRAAKKACAGAVSAGARARCVEDASHAAVEGASPGARAALVLALQSEGETPQRAVAAAE